MENHINDGVAVEMPKYRCHKTVWALKIAGIENNQGVGEATITPVESRYAPFRVSSNYMTKHNPQVGGYYVVYQGDGYTSYSPSQAFEEGYTRI
jgi:hypothetical protein